MPPLVRCWWDGEPTTFGTHSRNYGAEREDALIRTSAETIQADFEPAFGRQVIMPLNQNNRSWIRDQLLGYVAYSATSFHSNFGRYIFVSEANRGCKVLGVAARGFCAFLGQFAADNLVMAVSSQSTKGKTLDMTS